MRFISYTHKGGPVSGGILEGQEIRPLASKSRHAVLEHIESGASAPSLRDETVALGDVQLQAPHGAAASGLRDRLELP